MPLRFLLAAFLVGGCGAKTGIDLSTEPFDAGRTIDGARPVPTSPRPPPTPATSAPPQPDPPKPNVEPPLVCSNVTGTWAGTWSANSGASGTWRTDMAESGSGQLSGSSAVTGTQCGTSSTIFGERQGCSISFGLADFGSCSVDFVGTVSGDQMSGTFKVISGVNDSGRWQGTRVR